MPPKSKAGEGIVIIVDVGPHVRASTETTFFSQAKTCLINILQRKIFAEKCKDMIGIVLFGTDATDNKLAKNNQYQHITVLQEPKFVDWDMIALAERLPRGNSQGDWLDALIVAMDLLHDPNDINYSNQKIVLMTDFNTDFTDDKVEEIIQGLNSIDIDLSVIGPCMDDNDTNDADMPDCSVSNRPSSSRNGQSKSTLNWNGKVKTSQQLAAEVVIRRIVLEVGGIICDFDEAIPQLIFFEKKSQGSANWNAIMDIGSDFKIPVTGKIKIKHATPASWKKIYVKEETEAIIKEVSYHKKDENQTVVEERDVISGYKYGTTLVPFGDEDEKLKYVCNAEGATLSVLGFTRSSNVPLNLRAGDQVVVITAKDGDEDGAVALSALIQALKELDMVAITRRVYRKNLNPVVGALYPDITTDYECLIWIGLPFQEDVRSFTFPSLDKTLEKVTKAQKDIMNQLITAMDLGGKDDDDEELEPTQIVNPQLQHHFNCLTQRAISPEEPLPAPPEHILDLLSPPECQKQARDLLAAKLNSLFPTVKQESKTAKKTKDPFANSAEVAVDTKSNMEVDVTITSSDLLRSVVTKVSTVSPAEDFRALLKGDQPNYNAICQQMEDVIFQLTESLSGEAMSDRISVTKIVESLKVFREEATMIDPSPYNSLLQQLKLLVTARGFTHLWLIVQQDGLGLIRHSETLKSSVSEEEAEQFLLVEEETKPVVHTPAKEDNYEDLLDDL